jgi:formylmethanofuran dehydrogenase subunit E
MTYPAFFDDVAPITLYDPLAEFLGAVDDGLIEYRYLDAVKLAGHSCPTVAGAYLMTLKALQRLYPAHHPERGAVRIEFASAQTDGVSGVIGAVAGLLTGAAGEGGFKGLAGRFDRRNLLTFAARDDAGARFVRVDTGAAVSVRYHPEVVPASSDLQALLSRVVAGAVSAAEKAEFRQHWQARVKRILVDHCDDPALIVCRDEFKSPHSIRASA